MHSGPGTPGLRQNSGVQAGSWESVLGVTSFHEIQGPEQTAQTPHPRPRMPLTLQSMASMQNRIKTQSLIADLTDEFNQPACPGLGGACYKAHVQYGDTTCGGRSVGHIALGATNTQALPQPLVFARKPRVGGVLTPTGPSLCPPLPPAQSAAVSGCLVAKERMLLVTLGRARDVHLARCGPTSQSRDRSLREPLRQGSRGPQKPGSPTRCTPRMPGPQVAMATGPGTRVASPRGPVCMSPSSSHPQDGDAPEHFYSISSSFF